MLFCVFVFGVLPNVLQVSQVVSVNEGGGVSVRIPSRDSSLASVSV